ncbi:hypothetical protein TNIN_115071 [Trichonephila inaurata madagascariensis]|uniref:Uncharacterized protein n=1 Tax=Trichonephila inaurata madagascariensis TaxID=2747483 RepID=A0A8X6YWS3_9ARAC|nr:hypothetical protein TNIN_115071 [Trichonephila inaurata madagascariensis]
MGSHRGHYLPRKGRVSEQLGPVCVGTPFKPRNDIAPSLCTLMGVDFKMSRKDVKEARLQHIHKWEYPYPRMKTFPIGLLPVSCIESHTLGT